VGCCWAAWQIVEGVAMEDATQGERDSSSAWDLRSSKRMVPVPHSVSLSLFLVDRAEDRVCQSSTNRSRYSVPPIVWTRAWVTSASGCRVSTDKGGLVRLMSRHRTYRAMGSSRLMTLGRAAGGEGGRICLGGSSSITYWCNSARFSRCRNL